MTENDARDAVLAAVDDDRAVAWLQEAVAVPSVTGDEMAFARLVEQELQACGVDEVHVEEVAPGRPIVWSRTRGSGDGPTLMITGHLDTVSPDGWAEGWAAEPSDSRADPFGGAIAEGGLWGRGSVDVKGGIAAGVGAVRALHQAGVALQGDLITAWVADEETGEPGTGRSIGMHGVVERIVDGRMPQPDFAVYVEPTGLAICPAQIGFFVADITLEGRTAYFSYADRAIDALRCGGRVLDELWRHADELGQRESHPLVDRLLLVTQMHSGRHLAIPGDCTMTVLRLTLPSEDLAEAAQELEDCIARGVGDSGVQWRVDYPAGRDHAIGGTGMDTPSELPAIGLLREAVAAVAPGRDRIEGVLYWSEMPLLDAIGTPGVYFAAGDIATAHTPHERVPLDEYLAAVRALALFSTSYLGVADPAPNGQA
jgi:acetylornithine deacetylase